MKIHESFQEKIRVPVPKPTFSRISKALLQSGSASLYLPRFPYNTAKLLSVAATAGWFSPRHFSRICNASFNKLAASLYLFWSLKIY